MTNTKYEFVPGDEKTIAPGRTVKRIRYLATGGLGGYLESEKNLSVCDNARVSGDAQVYGDALVSGDAQVYGDALVYGNALVSGDAQVYGDALVYSNARVSGDALVSSDAQVYGDALVSARKSIVWFTGVGSENGTLTVYAGPDGTLIATRGCFIGSDADFLAQVEKVHGSTPVAREYALLIEVARSRILGVTP